MLLFAWRAFAQTEPGNVPRVINFSGVVAPDPGGARSASALVTLSVYAEQTGGSPLWSEQHTVAVDSAGRYSVLLGSLTQAGIPAEVFVSSAARWVGVTVNGGAEGARFMLISVPYALKAADADTVGGKAASDFVLTTNFTEKVTEAVKESRESHTTSGNVGVQAVSLNAWPTNRQPVDM